MTRSKRDTLREGGKGAITPPFKILEKSYVFLALKPKTIDTNSVNENKVHKKAVNTTVLHKMLVARKSNIFGLPLP